MMFVVDDINYTIVEQSKTVTVIVFYRPHYHRERSEYIDVVNIDNLLIVMSPCRAYSIVLIYQRWLMVVSSKIACSF
jgi:hypothetical protein